MCTFNAIKLLLFTFYLNGRLNAVSIGKPSEWMSNFRTVRLLKTESEQNFSFPHIHSDTEYKGMFATATRLDD